ncbi:MAG: MFS transporter [bacterium]|nr:MFS transporter [bacterium]
MANDMTTTGDNRKNMMVAYLLWFFFGNLGLHRFYLGRRESGIGYMALSIVLAGFGLWKGGLWVSYAAGVDGPIALIVFAIFIRLFWIFDGLYTAMLVRKANDPDYEPSLDDLWQPFIDLVQAPRALWGINLAYCLEGWVYFGMLGYLAMHFSDYVFLGVPNQDIHSHHMVMVLTAGITISMFFLGSIADKRGVRRTLMTAFLFLVAGRIVWAGAAKIFTEPGLWGGMHLMTMGGILLVVIGYGMYQPAAYAGVRQFTSPRTASMSYAMLYALMNLGGWLPSFFSPVREKYGIPGAFWVYTGITVVALIATFLILTRKVEKLAIARAEKERADETAAAKKADGEAGKTAAPEEIRRTRIPVHLWATLVVIAAGCLFLPKPWGWIVSGLLAAVLVVFAFAADRVRTSYLWFANHPLGDLKFFFFIFALIPVQTLFTYNWLILPQYLERAFEGGIVSEKFEVFANLNPILIFFAVPMVTALTQKRNVYNMMIMGTLIMAAPAFLLGMGTSLPLLLGYLFIMTIGEAMWQPRFLQYAAEIAPEGRTGAYMGVAQFPWFLTKMLVPLYSGYMMQHYVPSEGARNPESMWLIFAVIAMVSPVLLVAAKGWVGKDFKTKA